MGYGILVGLVLALGMTSVFLGRRGRRVDDHPTCRRCGFDLSGKPPESTRCAECGADPGRRRAIRIGNRVPRRWLSAAGWAVLGPMVLFVGIERLGALLQVRWASQIPTAWLMRQLNGPATRADQALAELRSRMQFQKISGEQVGQIVDQLLDIQADPKRPWNDTCDSFILWAHNLNYLTPAQQERFVRQGLTLTLWTKPKVCRGQTMWVELDVAPERARALKRWTVDYDAVLMWGNRIIRQPFAQYRSGPKPGSDAPVPQGFGKQSHGAYFPLAAEAAGGWEGGEQALTAEMEFTVVVTSPFQAEPYHFSRSVSQKVELLPAGADTGEFVVDPSLRQAVRESIREVVFTWADGRRSLELLLGRSPIDLRLAVGLVRNGLETRVGWVSGGAGGGANWSEAALPPMFNFTDGTVDVVLRPDKERVQMEPSLGRYWGEEIVVRDVPVPQKESYDPWLVNDESLRPAMDSALKVRQVRRTERSFVEVEVGPSEQGLPVRVQYDVSVRGVPLAPQTLQAEAGKPLAVQRFRLQLPSPVPPEVEVVLQPQLDRGSRSARGKSWGVPIAWKLTVPPVEPAPPPPPKAAPRPERKRR